MKAKTQTLDATGLLCPMPVLRAQKILREMATGEVLEMHTTDPASWTDIPAFCQEAGHRLVSQEPGDTMAFIIEKR